MKNNSLTYLLSSFFLLMISLSTFANTGALVDLGMMAPNSTSRGIVATQSSHKVNIVLVWLHDDRGGYGLLMIYPGSGNTKFFPTPFPIPTGTTPYASILSSKNKYYTHFENYFVEFDVLKEGFTKVQKTSTRMAMSMTEADDGTIWSATYPEGGLVSYNPTSKEFNDYGIINKEKDWAQYPRAIATDDEGYVYIGIGFTKSILVSFDPRSGQVKKIFDRNPELLNFPDLARRADGKVYAPTPDKKLWLTMHKGYNHGSLRNEPVVAKVPYITSSQALFHKNFQDGSRITALNLTTRQLSVADKAGKVKTVSFDYPTKGAEIVNFDVTSTGRIIGGTAFPFTAFDFDTKTKTNKMAPTSVQWNAVNSFNNQVFIGGYTGGSISKIDLKTDTIANFKTPVKSLLNNAYTVYRPLEVLPLKTNSTVILAGTPDYGKTGGGLHFWDHKTNQSILLDHKQVVENQSTMSMITTPGKGLLAGTTISPGTGGKTLATEAELYFMNTDTQKVLWRRKLLPNVKEYNDLIMAKNGKIYGIADGSTFFVFENYKKIKIIKQQNLRTAFGALPASHSRKAFMREENAECALASNQNERIYILFRNKIAEINTETDEIVPLKSFTQTATTPGRAHHGKIYFGSGSHMYSYEVPCLN